IAWITPGPPPVPDAVVPLDRPAVPPRTRSARTPSVARPPTEHDLAAMAAEAAGDAPFRFFRSGQVPPDAALAGVTLVVLDGVAPGTGLDAGARLGGVPRLVLPGA